MYTAKVKKVEPFRHQASGEERIQVEMLLEDENGERVDFKRMDFSRDASAEEIQAEVVKYRDTFESDSKKAVQREEEEAKQKHVQEVVEELSDLEIRPDNKMFKKGVEVVRKEKPEKADKEKGPERSVENPVTQ